MNWIETLTTFLGWSTVINFGVLAVSAIPAWSFEIRPLIYFQYLAQYKIAIFVFNLVPYIALKIMA